MSKEAFVYRWRHTNGMWYIGYHKGTHDDGYICSSETARPAIENDPDNWCRKILRYGTKKEMLALERRILTKLNAKDNDRSYNRSNGYPGLPISELEPLDIQVVGTNTQTYYIDPRLERAIREVSGKSYYTILLENFFNAVRNKNRGLVKEYIPMIETLFGIKMEMK